MFKYGILSTASIIDRFVAGIRESKDGHVQALASRTLDNAKKAAKRLDINNYYGSINCRECMGNFKDDMAGRES